MFRLIPLTLVIAFVSSTRSFAQQLPNADFEYWENVGTTAEEPEGWNGIISGNLCLLCGIGSSQRIFKDQHEKVSGQSSLRIESKWIMGDLVFNGTVTTGRVIAPSTAPSKGYSQTRRTESDFNLPFALEPDSLVFWAKYNITDDSDSALVSFFLHEDVSLKDPASSHFGTVAICRKTFQTNGNWQRMSLPFKYLNEKTVPKYLLATFGSNFAAGKGNGNAKLWIDDIQLIYNQPSLTLKKE